MASRWRSMDVSSYPAANCSGEGSTINWPHWRAHLMSRPERYMGEFSVRHERGVGDLVDVVVRQVHPGSVFRLAFTEKQADDVPCDLVGAPQLRSERLFLIIEAVLTGRDPRQFAAPLRLHVKDQLTREAPP